MKRKGRKKGAWKLWKERLDSSLKAQWLRLAKTYFEFKNNPSVRSFLKFIVGFARLVAPVLMRWLGDRFF